jgi:hypothetical protein
MINKFSAFIIAFAFVLSGIAFADTKTKKTNVQNNQLAALLPASDGVMTLNVSRLLSEAVPQVFSSKPQTLGDINSKIDEIRDKTGFDLRQFEQIAVGVSTRQISAGEIDFEPLVLARGKYNSGSLLALAKLASQGKYREETIGTRTIYVFSGREIVGQHKPRTKNAMIDKIIDKMMNSLSKEIAVTSFDNNTLAFGTAARVRETFETKTRVGADVLNMVNRKPNAVLSFGAKLPSGLSKFIELENDELGTVLDSIRQMSGAMEVSGGNANMSIAARTLKADQARNLHETLEGLQMVGKAFIGGSRGADKQVYARMIEAAQITRSANEVMLNVRVAQSDIDILLGAK